MDGDKQPKVFISYSWSSPEHQEQIRVWAERLVQDAVDVVFDLYDFKEGHDKYTFMERMVTDPTVTHVLVFSDKVYSEKADAKKAGVGTESQIISREVYEKVDQSKFIPVVCEFSESGEPFLPTFFKSRKWVDFSSVEAANENWERLIRILYGKPLHQKPALGKPPAYIVADSSLPADPSSGKFETFRHALLSGRKNLKAFRTDFLDSCIEFADSLRIRERPEVESMGQKVIEDCLKLKAVRNRVVDWVLLESREASGDEFKEELIEFLERLRELKARPEGVNSWSESWFEAHSVFVYETFLYIVAALLKTGSYEALHEIFNSHYLKPKTERYGNEQFETFGCFYGHSESLQAALGTPGRRLYSPAAELLKRQADRNDLPFSSLIEGELLVLLMAFTSEDTFWYPQTLLYASSGEFPFFVRAAQHRYFLKLATITGFSNAEELRKAVKAGQERLGINQWYDFHLSYMTFWNRMNMDALDSLK